MWIQQHSATVVQQYATDSGKRLLFPANGPHHAIAIGQVTFTKRSRLKAGIESDVMVTSEEETKKFRP